MDHYDTQQSYRCECILQSMKKNWFSSSLRKSACALLTAGDPGVEIQQFDLAPRVHSSALSTNLSLKLISIIISELTLLLYSLESLP